MGSNDATNRLNALATKGDWNRFFQIYQEYESTHNAAITDSGETPLHVALSRTAPEDVVEKMLGIIIAKGVQEAYECLKMADKKGNTAFHLAASKGYARVCDRIVGYARVCDRIVAYPLVHLDDTRNVVTRQNILHVAVSKEHTDEVINLSKRFPELVDKLTDEDKDIIRRTLFILVMKGEWERVIGLYSGIPAVHKFKITKSDDTALHIAVNEEQEKVVQDLVNLINSQGHYKKDVVYTATQSRKYTNGRMRDTEKQDDQSKRHQLIPPNYICFIKLVKFFSEALLVIVGLGSSDIENIKGKKENHIWAAQVMNELLRRTKMYEYESSGCSPFEIKDGGQAAFYEESHDRIPSDIHHTVRWLSNQTKTRRETPILIAAKNGIKEMVEKILDHFPVAIHDQDAKEKNIVLLAVENRQPRVYEFLASRKGTTMIDRPFRKVDDYGNSALHLAANFGDYKPWRIPGASLQMQWEFKWYEYVKKTMPAHFFPYQQRNTAGKTAEDLFTESHTDLVKEDGQWLTNTSQSCSVVAGLIANVAFATAPTFPAGVNQENGLPVLEKQPAFNVFSIASLVALCFSVTAVVMFLSILTSRHQMKDLRRDLPTKLLVGLTALFISIAAILVSFCAGHFFVLKDELRFAVYPVYVVTCLPVTFFAIAQFPLYFDLVKAFLNEVPQHSYMVRDRIELL